MNLWALANAIQRKLKESFDEKFLSGNLKNTITIEETDDGINITIPAQRYNISLFNEKGVVQYNSNGSYAQAVDEYGGFSKTHTNYVEFAITDAIRECLREENEEAEVKIR